MKKYLIICLSVALIFVAAAIYLFLQPRDSEKTVEQFLEAYIHEENYLEYLSPTLINHPFINLILDDNRYFKGFEILNTEKQDAGLSKVWVSLKLSDGSISVPFIVERIQNKNYIVSLPKATNIAAAIPIEKIKESKKASTYKVDVNGTHLFCISVSSSQNIEIGTPASLLLIEDYIISYSPMTAVRLNRVMSVSKEYIEDSVLGLLPIASELAVYEKTGDSLKYLNEYSIPVGIRDVLLFHSGQDKAESRIAILNRQNLSRDTIRVVLHNSDYKSLTHDEIQITCEQPFTVKNIIESKEYSFDKNESITFRHEGYETALYHRGSKIYSSPHRWYVYPRDNGILIARNIHRAYVHNNSGTPYRGTLEIISAENGLILVNEVLLEHYLYSVVPSEMPIRFGLESLKVQAIAARSYAIRCFESKGFAALGAHVDDSTSSQVYNNVEENPIAIQAVQETHGLVPFWGDEIVDTRFFSTSCGYTANAHEVWSIDDQFPGKEIPYLSAKPQFSGDAPSLHNEENFRAFIDQWEINGYDQFSPYFRWKVNFTRQQLEAVINKSLSDLQKTQPSFVLTRGTDGTFISKEIPEEIGELQNIEVIRRGEGGNIMAIEISTTRGIFRIYKELNIRRILQPSNLIPGEDPIKIECHDGTILKDFSILPSAFAYIEISRDATGQLTSVTIKGGGYGHGAGLSQYGCYGLSLMGKSYSEIIEHYYPGTELRSIY